MTSATTTTTKACPDCAEEVDATDAACRFCGYRFGAQHVPGAITSTAGPAPGTPTVGSAVSGFSVAAILALLGGVLMAVGSVGPWVTTFVVSVSGTQGDGQITLAAAGAAIVFTVLASTRQGGGVSIALALVAGLAGGAVGVYDFNNIHHKLQGIERLGSVGWGLYAVIAGAALIVVGAASSANAKR